MAGVTSNPPAGEPEPRWQQPSFGPQPPDAGSGVPAWHPVPAPARHVPPPSALEGAVGVLRRVIWPIAILVLVTTHVGFVPLLVAAIVANVVLGAVRRNLRRRRYAAALPPAPPTHPPQPDDLR